MICWENYICGANYDEKQLFNFRQNVSSNKFNE